VYVILGSAFTSGTTFDIPVGASITPSMMQPNGFYVTGGANQLLGTAVVSAGGIASGTRDDLLIGGVGGGIDGRVVGLDGRVYPAASFGLQQIATGMLQLISTGPSLGEHLTALDFNGDTYMDFAVQASTGGGRVYIYPNAGGAGFSTGTRVEITNAFAGGTSAGDGFGNSLALGWHPFLGSLSDIDRNGREDLIVGARQRGTEAAGLELYYGTNPIGSMRRENVDTLIQPTPVTPAVERTVGTVGDINNDGFNDMAVGDPTDSSNAGRFFFVY
jgi:hypothetical protein